MYHFNQESLNYQRTVWQMLGLAMGTQLTSGYAAIDEGHEEEIWELSERFQREATEILEIQELVIDKISRGRVLIYLYKGKLIWLEQNASPFIIYAKA